MISLQGKNAIITGASRGLGVYIAREMASQGINLVLAARNKKGLEVAANDLSPLDVKIITSPTDITSESDRIKLVKQAEEQLGSIDILINNAAIIQWATWSEQNPQTMRDIIETNLMSTLLLSQKVLLRMRERGKGNIVTIASIAGKIGIPFEAAYSASKAGLLAWSNALRLELAQTNINISTVLPSFVKKSGMAAGYDDLIPRSVGAVEPEAVAKAVIKVLQRNLPEIIVRETPTRPLLALKELSPSLGNHLLQWTGTVALQRRILRHKTDPRPTEAKAG